MIYAGSKPFSFFIQKTHEDRPIRLDFYIDVQIAEMYLNAYKIFYFYA